MRWRSPSQRASGLCVCSSDVQRGPPANQAAPQSLMLVSAATTFHLPTDSTMRLSPLKFAHWGLQAPSAHCGSPHRALVPPVGAHVAGMHAQPARDSKAEVAMLPTASQCALLPNHGWRVRTFVRICAHAASVPDWLASRQQSAAPGGSAANAAGMNDIDAATTTHMSSPVCAMAPCCGDGRDQPLLRGSGR